MGQTFQCKCQQGLLCYLYLGTADRGETGRCSEKIRRMSTTSRADATAEGPIRLSATSSFWKSRPGGMGVVYKVRQKDLDRTVALKMILSSRLASAEEVRRFQQEAKAAASLRHPSIVGIHEVGQVHGQHYFTMDYIEGRSLAKLLADGPLDPDRAARCLLAVARAVDYLHPHDIVHRDLKPSNILLDEHDQPFVTDFGLAKLFQDAADNGDRRHSRHSRATWHPSSADQNAEHFSAHRCCTALGAVLYEMLTGGRRFARRTN